jgi:hypothetical protein
VPVTPPRLAVTVTGWFPVTAEAVSKPPLSIVAKLEFSLHAGVIALVVPLSHVPVAENVPVPPSSTVAGPLTAMLISVADGGGGGGGGGEALPYGHGASALLVDSCPLPVFPNRPRRRCRARVWSAQPW